MGIAIFLILCVLTCLVHLVVKNMEVFLIMLSVVVAITLIYYGVKIALKQKGKKDVYRKVLDTPEPTYMPICEELNSDSNDSFIATLKKYYKNHTIKFNEFSKEVAYCEYLVKRLDAQKALKLFDESEITKEKIESSKKKIEKISNELKQFRLQSYKMGEIGVLLDLKKEFTNLIKIFQDDKGRSNITSFNALEYPLIELSNENVAILTEFYILLFNLESNFVKILSYKELKIQSDYFVETLPNGKTMLPSDEYAGKEWRYQKIGGGPDLRYKGNTFKIKVYRGRLRISIEGSSTKIDYKTRIEAIEQRKIVENYCSILEEKGMRDFVSFVTSQELCFNAGQLYKNFIIAEKKKRETLEQERIKAEKIKRDAEEKARLEERKRKREEIVQRKKEEERKKKELEEKRRIEEEKYKQELALRETKVNESKVKKYNFPEEMPLYLMLNIDNPERLFTNSIMELGLSTRVVNVLSVCGCNDVFSLLSFSVDELMKLNNLGKSSVSETIRLLELKYKGQATYVFDYRERRDAKVETKRSGSKLSLTDEEIRMIVNARKEKEQEEKRIAEEEKQKVFGEDISLITSSPIVQVRGTNEITNNIFNLMFRLIEKVEGAIDLVFVDDCGEKISNTKSVCFTAKEDVCKVSFELLSGKSFSSKKQYYLLILKHNSNSIIGKLEYKINIAFVSDFEF